MNQIRLSSRGIIVHEDKLLVVKHVGAVGYCALPCGRIEEGESPVVTLERELFEELGIHPIVGKLRYVNTFVREGIHNVDFIFEIRNSEEFFNAKELKGTHEFELSEIIWLDKENKITLLPKQIKDDFIKGELSTSVVRFIT